MLLGELGELGHHVARRVNRSFELQTLGLVLDCGGASEHAPGSACARAFDSLRTEDVVGRCRDSGGRADERGQAERKEDKRLGLLLAKTHVPLPSGRAYAQHRAPDARARHHLERMRRRKKQKQDM